jgi:hypothetical protein
VGGRAVPFLPIPSREFVEVSNEVKKTIIRQK